jgi:nitrite reductase (NADH) large subunit
VIVGAGPVGIRVAQELYRRDSAQSIIVYGDEPWEPYNRVRLYSFLAGELAWEDMTRGLQLPADTPAVRQVYSRIVAIDREQRRVRDQSGHWQSYSSLVLTTGSKPYVPAIPGAHLSGIYTFRDMNDTQKLFARQTRSRQVVVLGGGLLGLESARAMQRFNTRVTVVEAFDRLMARQLDEAGARVLCDEVTASGIEVILGESIKQIIGEDRLQGIQLRSGRI